SWDFGARESLQAELSEQLDAAKAHMRMRLRFEIIVAKRRISARLVSDLKAIRGLLSSQPLEYFDRLMLSMIRRTISIGMSEFFTTTSQQYADLLDKTAVGVLETFITSIGSNHPYHL
ncbi:hypothetical protein BGW39_003142, partial [Mortierella sp. 14UC]